MTNPHRRGPRVCLVVPCYNEAHRLDSVSFRGFLAAHTDEHILFVDDGSRDGTRQVLERLCEGLEDRASVLALPHNCGKAEAVRAGVNQALEQFTPEIIGFWDADLATPISAVDDFLRVFHRYPEILMVFGARVKLLGRNVKRHAVRHYLGRVFATAVSTMLRLAIYDTQCGAKLFRVNEPLRSAFARPFLSKWVFDVEILARYLNFFSGDTDELARSVYEYPLEQWIDIAGSKVRPKDFLKAFVDIVRIRRTYL
jgi:glycosyltransferase involved in cell wall biosynthesis